MALVRGIYILAVALMWEGLFALDLHAQTSPFDPDVRAQASRILESVDLLTDRSLYISGEVIGFSARVQNTGLPDGMQWSRILYLELFSAAGEMEAQGKFRIRRSAACGELRIPEGLLTGTYYLRAYTRWMRNRDPSLYAHMPLRIINPFTKDQAENSPKDPQKIILNAVPVTRGALEISKPLAYDRGDSLGLELRLNSTENTGNLNGCLSIVPAAARPMELMQADNIADGGWDDFQLNFLPDLRGITLSGRVRDPHQEPPGLSDTRVHFTMLGGHMAYSVARSDSFGIFALSLPFYEGRVELLVQPEVDDNENVEVLIDQDFDKRVSIPEVPDFSLSPEEMETLIAMARKYQLSEIYLEPDPAADQTALNDPVPFYGTPDFSLNMEDYVLLPTLEEVFLNLVPSVTPLRRRNRTDLLIASANPAISLFPPLVMIDQVPLFSMEQFLSVPPGKLSHIDVITDVYLKGDMRYGGIINLRTGEGNLAGIDLPDHSFFIDFKCLYPPAQSLTDRMEAGDQIPDTRNTILWMPDVQIEGSRPLPIFFRAPDYPGEYVVLFRGWDAKGEYVSAETSFLME